MSKKINLISLIILCIIAGGIGLYFRLYPLLSMTSSDASEKASVLVLARIQQVINHQIETENPNISQHQKNILKKKLLDETVRRDKIKIQQTIRDLSKTIPPTGQQAKAYPYLLASDSYYYLELTQNIIDTGNISDTFKGSNFLHKRMLAPDGHWVPITLHPFIGFYLFKIMSIFNPHIDLIHALSFTPLIIILFAFIPFLLICRRLKCSNAAIFTGSIFFLLSSVFLKRSMYGWYDNDPYNILFPFLILLFLFISLASIAKSKIKGFLFAGLTAISVFLYAFFWQGWVLMFALLFAIGCALIFMHLFDKDRKQKIIHTTQVFGLIFGGSFLLISLIFGMASFFNLFKEGWIALQGFMNPQLSVWPDLYISVAELKKTSLTQLHELIGGSFVFWGGIIGLVLSFFCLLGKRFRLLQPLTRWFENQDNPHDEEPLAEIIAIAIFLFVAIFLTLGAQRFAILCIIPLSLSFTLGLQLIAQLAQNIFTLPFQKTPFKKFVPFFISILVISLSFLAIKSAQKTIHSIPDSIFNATWEKALLDIKAKTPDNTIVIAWWPPGHFIKSIAHRRVTFDGGSINMPQAYWLMQIYLSQTEEQALGLLRMLNTSGNAAIDYLESLGAKTSTGVKLLKEITPLPIAKAQYFLSQLFPEPTNVAGLLALTHQEPPPTCLMLYSEFMEKNIQLGFIGKWDFKKIEMINAHPKLLKQIPPQNSPEYISFLWELVGGPYKYSPALPQISRKDNVLLFQENVIIDLASLTCNVNSKTYGKGTPFSLFYVKDGQVHEKELENPKLHYSVILFSENGKYKTILMDTTVARSVLVKLYYFNAIGMKYFEPIVDETDMTGRTHIKAFTIKWEEFINQ